MRSLIPSGFAASTAAILLACTGTMTLAQETTSTIRGNVTAAGAPVIGATVTAVHVPSGTTSSVVTGNSGAYSLPGMRPGGPYKVTVVSAGNPTTTVDGISLSVAEPLNVPIEVGEALAEVTVSGEKVVSLSPGPSTTLDRLAVEGVASVQRDIRDIVRHDPYASFNPSNRGVSIAGTNNRMNRFAVDGVRFSDNFGLNQGGLPTTRGPVPLDAVEQLSVKVAPYDVTEGDFQGGSINVVLRSGTNDYTGSVFYTYTNDDLTGDKSRGTPVLLDFKSKNWGAFVAGPIIQDTLFFAFSYENLKQGDPAAFGLAGAPTVVPNVSQSQVDTVSAIAKSVYNYDTLGLRTTLPETDKKYTAKLDWNINDDHRLSYTGIFQRGYLQSPGSGSPLAISPTLFYTAYATNEPENVDSHVVQLNSRWGGGFSTELRANQRKYDKIPSSLGAANFAQFQVCLDPVTAGNVFECTQGTTATPGTPRLYLGTEAFSQADVVKQGQKGLELVGRYDWGDHSFKAQAAISQVDITNVFVANSLGSYYFDSLAEFQARQATTLTWQYSITGDLKDVAANFSYKQMNYGLQDSWNILPDLNLTAGVRLDTYSMSDRPPTNNFYVARYGFANTSNIDGLDVIQPRIGLTWKPVSALTVRAGGGLFNGGAPDVFLGNSFSVAGVYGNTLASITRSGANCRLGTSATSPLLPAAVCADALNGVTGLGIAQRAALFSYLSSNTLSLAGAPVNAMAPGFKLPSSWKANLSADYRLDFDNFLGAGWTVGADLYKAWVKTAAYYTDLRLTQVGTAPDGRPVYRDPTNGTNADLLMANTGKGESTIATFRLSKSWENVDFSFSYARQNIDSLSDMGDSQSGGSTANGTYAVVMQDPNFPAYGTSSYEIKDNFKFGVDFHKSFFADLVTRASLFAEVRTGTPYSLTMNSPGTRSIFGTTGTASRYLLYVPNVSSITADPKVTYANAATFNSLKDFIEAKELPQGQIIGKYTEVSPKFWKFDLHLEQELPGLYPTKIKVFADVENILNLLNNKWGALRVYVPQQPIVTVNCTNLVNNVCGPASQYVYSAYSAPNLVNNGRFGLWGLRVGLRVAF